eukprot:491781-Rhodomonas_salina.2
MSGCAGCGRSKRLCRKPSILSQATTSSSSRTPPRNKRWLFCVPGLRSEVCCLDPARRLCPHRLLRRSWAYRNEV